MYTIPLLLLLLPTLTLTQPTGTGTGTNSASDPSFGQGTNVTVSAWTRADCNANTDGHENIFFPDLLYGKDNHALVVSYMLGRDLAPDERLDMSFFAPDGNVGTGPDGPVDRECARFQFTASPDKTAGTPLKANTCYAPAAPVTCFSLWKSG